jgi:hypothetical protein
LPLLEVNGKTVIGQSMAVARYAARETGQLILCVRVYFFNRFETDYFPRQVALFDGSLNLGFLRIVVVSDVIAMTICNISNYLCTFNSFRTKSTKGNFSEKSVLQAQ